MGWNGMGWNGMASLDVKSRAKSECARSERVRNAFRTREYEFTTNNIKAEGAHGRSTLVKDGNQFTLRTQRQAQVGWSRREATYVWQEGGKQASRKLPASFPPASQPLHQPSCLFLVSNDKNETLYCKKQKLVVRPTYTCNLPTQEEERQPPSQLQQ